MTPAIELHKGDTVRFLGRMRLITSIAHHDSDGLSLIRFEDGAWCHCAPDQLFTKAP